MFSTVEKNQNQSDQRSLIRYVAPISRLLVCTLPCHASFLTFVENIGHVAAASIMNFSHTFGLSLRLPLILALALQANEGGAL